MALFRHLRDYSGREGYDEESMQVTISVLSQDTSQCRIGQSDDGFP